MFLSDAHSLTYDGRFIEMKRDTDRVTDIIQRSVNIDMERVLPFRTGSFPFATGRLLNYSPDRLVGKNTFFQLFSK